MPGKSFFIDTTRCTGCRGCQAACKQWNQNPGTNTSQRGTYQNPPDLSTATFKLVRFSEATDTRGEPNWHFFPINAGTASIPSVKRRRIERRRERFSTMRERGPSSSTPR